MRDHIIEGPIQFYIADPLEGDDVLSFSKWLEGRPEEVIRRGHQMPPCSILETETKRLYVLGYVDGGGIIVSEINPHDDYDAAQATRVHICPSCLPPLDLDLRKCEGGEN